jgi:CheY-like chemotaxis protein
MVFLEAIKKASPGTELSAANDGIELMELLNGQQTSSSRLVFLDLNMPVKTGQECLEEIRANAALKHIPVVIYSTSTSEDDIERAHAAGADFYVSKPASFNDLVLLIAYVIELNRPIHMPATRESFVLEAANYARLK